MNEQVSIDCGAADRDGKRLVIASLGNKSHRDRFDTDSNFARSKFIEKVIGKFKLPQSAHEWLNEEIERIADEVDEAPAASAALRVVSASEIEPATAEFLMPGFIPLGAITTFEGDPADGKSQVGLSIAARITQGIALPPAHSFEGQYDPANVIISNFEDDPARTIVPRLIAAGADLTKIQLIREVEGFDGNDRLLCLPGDIPRIEQQIIATQAVLWIVDVFTACLASSVSVNNDADIRRVTSQLSAMAERTKCAIVLIRHLNKKSGTHAMYRGGGSIAIAGASRSVLLVGRDPEDPDSRILASVKSNLCKSPASLRFHIEAHGDTSRVVWGDQCDLQANDLLGQDHKPGGGSKLETAKAILVDVLSNGPRGESEVLDAIESAEISTATYWRARKALNVHSEKTGFGKTGEWLLSLNGACRDEF